jgi:hypothetical protein
MIVRDAVINPFQNVLKLISGVNEHVLSAGNLLDIQVGYENQNQAKRLRHSAIS